MLLRICAFFLGVFFIHFGVAQLFISVHTLWQSFGHINIILMGCLFLVYSFTKQNILEIITKKIAKIYLKRRD